ncbi:MAG TPA: adenosine deaminase [Thermoanaerobaculia bacterium]|nr:adenosine deaminase [Thermoanaerobaculia bacterium]
MLRKLFVILLMATAALADEASTAARLESLREDPLLLRRFLEQMPKGGDLHQHLSGTVYAESYVVWAAKDGLCIDTAVPAYTQCSAQSETQVPAAQALTDSVLYGKMLDGLSMRQYRGDESGHDRFFAAFGRFAALSREHTGEMLAEVVSRFARENVDYIESLFGQDRGAARNLGRKVQPGTSFADMRMFLLQNGAADVVTVARKTIDDAEAHIRSSLGCSSASPQPGCESTVRYLFETHRAFPREQLFAELLIGFELARADSRVVGLNSVQPEDSYGSMTGFDELMRMLAYLRPLYPGVPVTLHAGELAAGMVPPEGLQNHIRDSVLIAGAERIGHGVDIARERDALELLRTMASRKVAVEVCLTSNDVILGVRGKQHPLRLYVRSGVPVVLATDDPGVARNDMTTEWQRAVEEHGMTYADLKRFARNSIEYSFLEGMSLWSTEACRDESSAACRTFLEGSAKARVQMRLERRLREFENAELR